MRTFFSIFFLFFSIANVSANENFNLTHPELRKGEVFVANVTESQFFSFAKKPSAAGLRPGIQSYTTNGEPFQEINIKDGLIGIKPDWKRSYPMFVNIEKYDRFMGRVKICIRMIISKNRQ